MSEIASMVFDLVNPSPVTLQELSLYAVAVELWRQEIGKYRKNNTNFCELPSNLATLKDAIPGIAPSIFSLIEQYVETLGSSISLWQTYHSFQEIHANDTVIHKISNKLNALNYFDDFACDFDGSIDYVGTAKRMMLCDQLTDQHKFKIACKYCLEDDILRLWPSVSDEIDLDKINFNGNPLLYYWVCCLKNELSKISVIAREISIYEKMLNIYLILRNWSSVAYFWNCLNFESQWRIAVKMIDVESAAVYQAAIFARYLLPKWNELSVDKFIAEKGGELINSLLCLGKDEIRYVIPVWMYIKNKINASNFIKIIQECLEIERESNTDDSQDDQDELLYCEIWETAPDNLKRSVIQNFILDDDIEWAREDTELDRDITFLSRVLSYASLEERNKFWRNKWPDLIAGTHSTTLHELMRLCIENENQIIEFKKNVMSKYENISPYCVQLLKNGDLVEIDNFLTFCCSDIETRRNLKQQLLQSTLLGEDSILKPYHFGHSYSLTDFINDAFGGADLAADFRSRLIMTPATFGCSQIFINSGNFSKALEILNMPISREPVAALFKNEFLKGLKQKLIECSIRNYTAESLQKILLCCLGSEEKITEFKKTLPVEEIFQNMVQQEKLQPSKEISSTSISMSPDIIFLMGTMGLGGGENSSTEESQADILVRRYPRNLNEFLNWYFVDPEEIAEFKRKFSDVFATFIQRDKLSDMLNIVSAIW